MRVRFQTSHVLYTRWCDISHNIGTRLRDTFIHIPQACFAGTVSRRNPAVSRRRSKCFYWKKWKIIPVYMNSILLCNKPADTTWFQLNRSHSTNIVLLCPTYISWMRHFHATITHESRIHVAVPPSRILRTHTAFSTRHYVGIDRGEISVRTHFEQCRQFRLKKFFNVDFSPSSGEYWRSTIGW